MKKQPHPLTLMRAGITLFHVLTVIPAIALVAWVPRKGHRWRLQVRRIWIGWILRGLGVKLSWQGPLPEEPCIIVANHRSYLDPLLILRHILALPVAKREMASWPLLGLAGRLSGIFYVQRESMKDRHRTLLAVADAVQKGETILIFPEGTTHDENQLRPFRRGVFQVAAQAGVPVVPLALDYSTPEDYWIGDDTFGGHFLRRFGPRTITCAMQIGPALRSENAEHLRLEAMSWIQDALPGIHRQLGRTPATT